VLHTEAWGPGRWPRSIAGLPEADAKHLTSLGLDWTSEDPGLFAAAVEHLAARGGHGWRLAVAKGNRAWSDYAATIGADTLDAIRAWDAASGDAPLGLGLSTKGRRSTLRERIEDAVKARLAKGLPLPAGVRNAAPALLDALVSACIEEYEAEARQTKARRAAARAAALGLETKGSGSE